MTVREMISPCNQSNTCLLYTSDAADDMQCVDLGGRRIIKKCKDLLAVYRLVRQHRDVQHFFKQKTAYEM
mgnify:CR=1 FL=1